MKTITRQRKEQLALEARGLCRYSENHGPHVLNGMCYECIIRHRKQISPHIPEWWPISIHFSKKRYQEFEASVFEGDLIKFCAKYDAVPEEVFFLAAKERLIGPAGLEVLLQFPHGFPE